ncbi:MAG: fructosamine kinase family protein [Chitinophagaceae bacterium]|nr:fructosamine kinase family protein [Chitinophagaceae bacterium]
MTDSDLIQNCIPGVLKHTVVGGGDINRSYCIHTSQQKLFLKINDSRKLPGMFARESAGLDALRNTNTISVPNVLGQGNEDDLQYLLLEWLDGHQAQTISWQKLGRDLAALHQHAQVSFGWDEDNFIGSLIQQNQPTSSWCEFYREYRIMPNIKKLRLTRQLTSHHEQLALRLCDNLIMSSPLSCHHFYTAIYGQAIL